MTEILHFVKDDYHYDEFKRIYTNYHKFVLFDSEALIGWNDGEDMMYIFCPASFQAGKKTGAYCVFPYQSKYKHWAASDGPPKGAGKVCATEIKNVLSR